MTAVRFYTTAELMDRIKRARIKVVAPSPSIVMVPFEGTIGASEKAAPVRDIMSIASPNIGMQFNDVLSDACKKIGVSVCALTGANRKASVAMTRHVLSWVGLFRCHYNFSQVGRVMSRDRTTVMSGASKIDRLIAERGLAVPPDPLAAALYLNRELGGV